MWVRNPETDDGIIIRSLWGALWRAVRIATERGSISKEIYRTMHNTFM